MSSRAPIGIFDSGIGGLTVVRAIHRLLPHESTVYFGDTARVPYGPKSPETVRRYAGEILDWLLAQHVKAVVVACNTATAHALPDLQRRASVPVVGVIEPGARAAAAATRSGAVGVIGTAGTIASGAYRRALIAARPSLDVHQQACPLFVPLVEEGWFDHRASELIAETYLAPWRAGAIDTIVMGCTHYPMLRPMLDRVVGPGVQWIDSGEATAAAVAAVLDRDGIAAPHHQVATHRWAASDDTAHFARVGAVFLGTPPHPVDLIDVAADAPLSEAAQLDG